jgi:acyl-CoA thioester hydrolase
MIYYKIYTGAEPDLPAVEGHSKVVWVDGQGKSQPLPDSVRCWFPV